MNEKVIVLSASGHISIVKIQPDDNGSVLRDLQSLVGGYIEVVRPAYLQLPYMIVCNEEGVINNLARNSAGSMLYGAPIFGDVVIMKEGIRDGEPDVVGLDDDEATDLANKFVLMCPWLKIWFHE